MSGHISTAMVEDVIRRHKNDIKHNNEDIQRFEEMIKSRTEQNKISYEQIEGATLELGKLKQQEENEAK